MSDNTQSPTFLDKNKDNNIEEPQSEQSAVETKPKLGIRDRLAQLPTNIDTSIEEGKGNSIIEGTQDAIAKIVTSIFSSCRLASLRLFMITPAQRKSVSKTIYILAVVIAGCICIDLLFEFSFDTILLAVCFLLGAYFADLVVQSAVFKTKHNKTSTKPKTNTKVDKKPLSTDNDIL